MLTTKQRSFLRSLGHKLEPVGFVGNNGVTSPVLLEIERQLREHELIKIKISADGQEDFIRVCDQIMETVDEAQLVQKIGHILILYRPSTKKAPKDRIRLPKDEKK